jgi:hypothetical protein
MIEPGKFQLLDRDYERDSRIRAMEGRPWKVTNLFPFPINVYIRSPVSSKLDPLGIIRPTDSIYVTHTQNGKELVGGDEIHVTFSNGKGTAPSVKQFEVVRPFYLFEDSRTIDIGQIVYETLQTTQHIPLNKDISGVRIHNNVGFPLDVYMSDVPLVGSSRSNFGCPFNGEPRFEREDPFVSTKSKTPVKIATIGKDDGLSFMSGSRNSVYTTNDYYGFNVGDKLTFVFPMQSDDRKGLVYGTATIPDNYLSDIKVGVIQQHRGLVPNDIFSYRVNEPNLSGLGYFEPVTAYESRKSTQDRFSGYRGLGR